MKNTDYIKFNVSKVESDLASCSNSCEYVKVITVLNALKISDNILGDIYVLSGIKKLRPLSSYIIFMIKKVEFGSINIDNFMENFSADKNFIRSYFQTYYDLEQISEEEFLEEEVDTKFIFDDEPTPAVPPVYSLTDPGFRVADLDNELVTEEFKDSAPLENYSEPGDDYMSLVGNKDENIITPDSSVFFTDSSDVFSLPGDSADVSKTVGELNEEETKNEASQTDENKNLAEFFEEIENGGQIEDSGEGTYTPVEPAAESEDGLDENKILKELIPVAPEINNVEESAPAIPEEQLEVDMKLQEIEKETSEGLLNSEFETYEKFLFEKNKSIFDFFGDLILINESAEPDIEMRDSILEEILKTVVELREYSGKMSFEVITGIYASLAYCFDLKFKDVIVSLDNLGVFSKALKGVEDLILGNDLVGFDEVVGKLNYLRDDLAKLLADRENFEKKKYDFGEEESNVIREFKDSSEYDAFLILRDKISELEETFLVIADMKDKTYPFESIRKLSAAFAIFREIVNISRILELGKISHLAEAGYVFVKFVQNYRIDPFKQEVSETFKFLIYCFKLLYLDKPVKDYDTFVSFLNQPVKIFYPKNKT